VAGGAGVDVMSLTTLGQMLQEQVDKLNSYSRVRYILHIITNENNRGLTYRVMLDGNLVLFEADSAARMIEYLESTTRYAMLDASYNETVKYLIVEKLQDGVKQRIVSRTEFWDWLDMEEVKILRFGDMTRFIKLDHGARTGDSAELREDVDV
jgi:hypothetical protein